MVKIGNLVNIPNGVDQGALEAGLLKVLPDLVPSLKVSRTRLEPKVGALRADLGVEVTTPLGRKQWLFFEVKTNPVPGLIRESLRRLKAALPKDPPGYLVVASTFVSPRVREVCREEGAGYLDLAGNCYLQLNGFYVEKDVGKNPYPRRGRPTSLFSRISSRVLRALLEEPARAWTLTKLSAATKVSLGQASKVCRRLIEEGYARRAQGGIRLIEPGKLLDAWREEYAPSNNLRVPYYSAERDPAQLMTRVAAMAATRRWRYAVTSFAGAALIAPFVRGIGVTTWYVSDAAAMDAWVNALDLRPVEMGPNVALLIPYDAGVFYRTQTINDIDVVGNIQLYLDLYGDPARGKEQAEFLRKEKIGF